MYTRTLRRTRRGKSTLETDWHPSTTLHLPTEILLEIVAPLDLTAHTLISTIFTSTIFHGWLDAPLWKRGLTFSLLAARDRFAPCDPVQLGLCE